MHSYVVIWHEVIETADVSFGDATKEEFVHHVFPLNDEVITNFKHIFLLQQCFVVGKLPSVLEYGEKAPWYWNQGLV